MPTFVSRPKAQQRNQVSADRAVSSVSSLAGFFEKKEIKGEEKELYGDGLQRRLCPQKMLVGPGVPTQDG